MRQGFTDIWTKTRIAWGNGSTLKESIKEDLKVETSSCLWGRVRAKGNRKEWARGRKSWDKDET